MKNYFIYFTKSGEQCYASVLSSLSALAPLPLNRGGITPTFKQSQSENFSKKC